MTEPKIYKTYKLIVSIIAAAWHATASSEKKEYGFAILSGNMQNISCAFKAIYTYRVSENVIILYAVQRVCQDMSENSLDRYWFVVGNKLTHLDLSRCPLLHQSFQPHLDVSPSKSRDNWTRCNLLEWKGIYKNCEPFTDQLQPICFTCNGLQTKPIGFKYRLSKVWRIMLCNTMKA